MTLMSFLLTFFVTFISSRGQTIVDVLGLIGQISDVLLNNINVFASLSLFEIFHLLLLYSLLSMFFTLI